MLARRWSAIAARLPGRTDNEIKNVWHTHLKKRLDPSAQEQHQEAKKRKKPAAAARKREGKVKMRKLDALTAKAAPVLSSPERSVSSTLTESTSTASAAAEQHGNSGSSASASASVKEECFTSSEESEEFQIDESFWSETLSMPLDDINDVCMEPHDAFGKPTGAADGDMDYWLKVFMEGGDDDNNNNGALDLPQI